MITYLAEYEPREIPDELKERCGFISEAAMLDAFRDPEMREIILQGFYPFEDQCMGELGYCSAPCLKRLNDARSD